MVRPISAEPVAPPRSVTEAVIIWLPWESVPVENEAPVPIGPSKFDVHAKFAVSVASSSSAMRCVCALTLQTGPIGANTNDFGS